MNSALEFQPSKAAIKAAEDILFLTNDMSRALNVAYQIDMLGAIEAILASREVDGSGASLSEVWDHVRPLKI